MTEPLLGYYAGRGVLRKVDAMGAPDDVFDRVVVALDELRSK